jgi:serine/threonine protein kinase
VQEPNTLLEGKYEILSKIREGGMGTIYLVRHRLLDRIRVIKVMRAHVSTDPELRRRFLDEAKMATRLNHPNICTIHDFAVDEDATAYLVMEFIEGVNLAELLALQGSPGIPLSLEIGHQALLALGYLHRKNVVHRDVAPDNLMLSKNEEGRPLVKVIDLGIAKAADRPTEMTATGVFLGKLRYASPEQAGSLGPAERLDGRSDLYSLGIVLYELLTGARPFSGNSPAELLRGQLFNPPLPFSQSDPRGRIPAELRAIILKALEKKREDRYASAEDFDQEILAIQQGIGGPEDLESTRALLSTIPTILQASGGPVTPSAQSRLNLQFAASTTPPPSGAHLTVAPTVSATRPSAAAPPPEAPEASDRAAKPPPQRRRRGLWPLTLLAAASAVAALLLISRRSSKPRPEAVDASLRVSPAQVAGPGLRAEPTLALPTPEPTLEPTAEPVPTRVAPKAAPAALPPTRRAAGLAKPAKPDTDARGPAAAPASEAMPVRPSAVPESAEPSRPVMPAGPEKAPAPAPAASPAVAPGASESDKIRETVRNYERAQSTLDAEMYARIFPSVDRARIAGAFQNLVSQTVEFEIRRIQVDPSGTHAEVHGFERRVAIPRAGPEQRLNAARVIYVEKRGDSWVISRLN